MAKQTKIEELESDLRHAAQVLYSKQTDWELATCNQRYTDIAFLKELEAHLEKWRDNRDVVSQEMSFKMVRDWIDDLTEQNEKEL